MSSLQSSGETVFSGPASPLTPEEQQRPGKGEEDRIKLMPLPAPMSEKAFGKQPVALKKSFDNVLNEQRKAEHAAPAPAYIPDLDNAKDWLPDATKRPAGLRRP